MDGEEGEYDDSGEGPDLESDPLLPGGDATDSVDLRLQQAHIALERGQDDRSVTRISKRISYVVRKVDLEGNTLGASHSDGDWHPASSQPHPALALLQVESCSICLISSEVFVKI